MYEIKITLGDAIFIVSDDSMQLKIFNKWTTTSHFHADNELHIVLNGNATVEIDGDDVEIKQGEICILAPKSSHYPKTSSDDLVKTNFSFNLTKNYNYDHASKNFSEYAYYDNVIKSIKHYVLLNSIELVDIIKEILELENIEQNRHVLQTAFANFFIKLTKAIKKRYGLTDSLIVDEHHESENNLKQRKVVEEFFQKRYNEQISINDLAKDLYLSVPQTHRIVKKIFGVGFKKTLMKQRIAHACMLIKQNTSNLIEIAELCGYISYNGFLSAFKSLVGKSPKEYEKSLK